MSEMKISLMINVDTVFFISNLICTLQSWRTGPQQEPRRRTWTPVPRPSGTAPSRTAAGRCGTSDATRSWYDRSGAGSGQGHAMINLTTEANVNLCVHLRARCPGFQDEEEEESPRRVDSWSCVMTWTIRSSRNVNHWRNLLCDII